MKNFSVSEEVWFGEISDDKAREAAARGMAALVAKVHGVRPFPTSARKLMKLADEADFSVKATAKIVEGDPAMAARVLRLVNSAAYALQHPCKSVPQAVVLLGARKLADVATAAAVLDMFLDDSPHSTRVLDHASAVATVSRHLAPLTGQSPDDMFTCGLLHDIGKLMFLQVGDEDYPRLLERVGDDCDTLYVKEREAYGYDHAVLAGHMLSSWKIPEPIPFVVGWHHNVSRAYKESGKLAAMVHLLRLADRLTRVLPLFESPERELVEGIAEEEAASYLGIGADTLQANWRALRKGCPDGRAPFGTTDGNAASVLQRAESLGPGDERALDGEPQNLSCIVCTEPSFGQSCSRCGGPLCAAHDSGIHPWCALCEREYVRRRSERTGDTVLRTASWIFAAGAVAMGGFGVGASYAPAHSAAFALVLVWGCVLAGLAYLRWANRVQFLAERPPPRAAR